MQKLALFIFILFTQTLMAQNVGIGTTTPLARLHIADSSVLFSAAGDIPPAPGNIPASGAGRRMLWYADKAALRAGYVYGSRWNKDSVGDYSIAMGLDTKAKGLASVALGYYTTAEEHSSVAMGISTRASAFASTAMGISSIASGDYSTALGSTTLASGNSSTAMGNGSIASGNYSTAIGDGTTAGGSSSTAMGISSSANGIYSTAMGAFTMANGIVSTATGGFTTASGGYSTSMGDHTKAKATASLSIGIYNDDTDSPSPTTAAPTDRILQVGNGTSSIRSNALTILRNGNTGIGVLVPDYVLDVGGRIRIRSTVGNTAGTWLNNDANNATPAFMGMRNDNLVGFYGNGSPNSGWGFLMNTTNGRVGIATDIPGAQLEVNGYTKLGNDAPSIKVKKLTGTTAGTEGVGVTIPHGLNYLKILSVTVIVQNAAGTWVGDNSGIAASNFRWDFNSFNVEVDTVFGNSSNILSRPIKVLITYEE